jgi:hypothetical protein
MEDSAPSKSRKIFIVLFLFLLLLIPLLLFLFTKTTLLSKINLAKIQTVKSEPQSFDSKYFSLIYPASLKAFESKPKEGILTLKTQNDKAALMISVSEYGKDTFKDTKNLTESALDYASKRERPYYAEFSGKTEMKGYQALIFSTDKPKDPETQKDLPPLTAYYIFIPGEKDGAENVKVVKIIYYGDDKDSLEFEKLIDTINLKNQ